MKKLMVLVALIPLMAISADSITPEMVEKYKKLATSGDAEAQRQLGFCYFYGRGKCRFDRAEALVWYKKSAEQGNAAAQYDLAECYEYGRGCEKSWSEALKLYMKSAKQGYAKAQSRIEQVLESELENEEDDRLVAGIRKEMEQVGKERDAKIISLYGQLPTRERFDLDLQPRKGGIYYFGEGSGMKLKITQFISGKNNGIVGALSDALNKNTDDSTSVIVRPDSGGLKYYCIKILDSKHDYVDGDMLEYGFYKYVGVRNFQDSRIRAFEEIEIADEFKDAFMPR